MMSTHVQSSSMGDFVMQETSGGDAEEMETTAAVEEVDEDSASLAESLFGEEEDYCEIEQDQSELLDLFTRPIIVGYAFGPKKMSTMGVVMAEASKTKLSRTTSTFLTPSHAAAETTTDTNYGFNPSLSRDAMEEDDDDECLSADVMDRKAMPSPGEVKGLTRAAILSNANSQPQTPMNQHPEHTMMDVSDNSGKYSVSPLQPQHHSSNQQQQPQQHANYNHHHQQQDTVVFTMDSGVAGISSASDGGVGLRNIVRYFHSSCSSVADSLSTGTGTCTASASSTTGSQFTASTTRPTTSSGGSTCRRSGMSSTQSAASSSNRGGLHQQHHQQFPVRVSFVPLDMEVPLDQQHGGQMDVVLHKLTEDILCLSQLASIHPELKNLSQFDSTAELEERIRQRCCCNDSGLNDSNNSEHQQQPPPQLTTSELAAMRRVHRLCQFQANHPECSLVDNPVSVQTLMSRSDIAQTLERCLTGVSSATGIAVSSPKSIVLQPPPAANDDALQAMLHQVQEAGLNFPCIVKPLIAAGTKASHAMAVLLEPAALTRITTPCLLQEYSNHDSLLYKVYVLGEHVSVHKRRSLPNLPLNRKSRVGLIEFDSQKTYPRLSDFGFEEATAPPPPTTTTTTPPNPAIATPTVCKENAALAESSLTTTSNPNTNTIKRKRVHMDGSVAMMPNKVSVTAEEVEPIVTALKGAFGLELFGFDVLITSSSSSSSAAAQSLSNNPAATPEPPRMLVVDVNYFPSYKELNFPELLARYLTDKGIERRRMVNPSL